MTNAYMNEEYFCNYCRKGQIRPIQFSLKQAIINCDNIDCESYLEKKPWECIITRPLPESSSLCKYERDSVCSSDSSGVHSDLGSSGLSQSSLTDREVELLLRKNNQSLNSRHFDLECFDQHFYQWPSEHKPINQEPFVALDQNSSSSNEMMSASDQNFSFEAVLNGASNEASSLENSKIIKEELLDMLKDINFEENHTKNFYTQKNQSDSEDALNQELESWLKGFHPSPHAENFGGESSLDLPEQQNGENLSMLSPSKALIPSFRSAFSEVSPSKINKKSLGDGSNISPSKTLLPNFLSNDTIFMSPASSGFSEENSGGEENSTYFNKLFHNTNHTQKTSSETKQAYFLKDNCVPAIKKEVITFSLEPPGAGTSDDFHFLETSLKDPLEHLTIKESCSASGSPFETKNINILDPQSPTSFSHPLKTENIPLIPTNTPEFTEHSDMVNENEPPKPVSTEETGLEEKEQSSDSELIETLNMLELLKHCTSTSKESLLPSPTKTTTDSSLNLELPSVSPDKNFHSALKNSPSTIGRSSISPPVINSLSTFPDTVQTLLQRSQLNFIANTSLPPLGEPLDQDSKDTSYLNSKSRDEEAKIVTSVVNDLCLKTEESQNQSSPLGVGENCQTTVLASPTTANCQSSSPLQIKIESLSDSENEAATKSKSLPKSSFKLGRMNQPNHCRRKTFFKGGFEVDPWSVPEVYIDELDIEVVMKSPHSGNSNDGATSTVNLPPTHHGDKRNNINGSKKGGKGATVSRLLEEHQIKSEVLSTPASPEVENSCHTSLTDDPSTHSPAELVCKKENSLTGEGNRDNPCVSQKIDIYKPVTFRPEVLKTEYFHEDPVSPVSSREPRQSVGYSSQEIKTENEEEIPDDYSKCGEPDRPTNYFNLLLSNLQFDENFAIMPPSEQCDSSIENFVSKRLFAEEFSSDISPPCNDNKEVPEDDEGMKINEIASNNRENPQLSNQGDGNTRKEVKNTKEEEESDNDIPVVTINSDDELAIFIPQKKAKEINCENSFDENGATNYSDLVHKEATYSGQDKREKGEKRGWSEVDFKDTKKLKSTHLEPSSISNNILDSIKSEKTCDVSIIENPSNNPVFVNVGSEFTMFNWHEKFGNLKKEPELFDNILDQEIDSDVTSLLHENVCKEGSVFSFNINNALESMENNFVLNEKGRQKSQSLENQQQKAKNKKSFRLPVEDCKYDNEYLKDSHQNLGVNLTNQSRPETKKSDFKNRKTKRQVTKRTRLLRPNPTVPEVLQLLQESGWAVTPCNPVINYNVPPHPISPTIVPAPLEREYGRTGSDVILWTLTDKEVSFPSVSRCLANDVVVPNIKCEDTIPQSASTTLNSCTSSRLKPPVPVEEKSAQTSIPSQFDRREKHIFPHSYNRNNHIPQLLKKNSWREEIASLKAFPPSKAKKREAGCTIQKSNSLGLKTLRTADGALYVRPSASILKKEPIPSVQVKEEPAEINEDASDDCIELPDDYVAYETALKGGFQVKAPPTLPKNVFIPPPSPQRQKYKRLPTRMPFSNSSSREIYPSLLPSKVEDVNQSKAEEELSSIVSQRSPNEVPDFVCMTIQGKMYVYHRKN